LTTKEQIFHKAFKIPWIIPFVPKIKSPEDRNNEFLKRTKDKTFRKIRNKGIILNVKRSGDRRLVSDGKF